MPKKEKPREAAPPPITAEEERPAVPAALPPLQAEEPSAGLSDPASVEERSASMNIRRVTTAPEQPAATPPQGHYGELEPEELEMAVYEPEVLLKASGIKVKEGAQIHVSVQNGAPSRPVGVAAPARRGRVIIIVVDGGDVIIVIVIVTRAE